MIDDKKSMSEAIEQLQKLAAPPSHPKRGPKPGAKRVAILKDRYKEASPRKPLAKLDVRGRNLLRLMTQGLSIEEEEFAEIIGVEIGEPLEVEQAADVLNIRRKNARWIAEDPLFIRERAVAVKELMAAKKPRAAFRLGKLVDEPGEGSAADRTVQLKAAQAVLGETIAPSRPGVSVTVNNNVQPLAAGIVIRLPQNIPPPPLETNHAAPATMDAEAIEDDFLSETVRQSAHHRRLIAMGTATAFSLASTGLDALGKFDKGSNAAANDHRRGQSTFMSDMFSAEQAETNADMGWLKATQTDTFLREKLGGALANIDAVMANTGTADNSPSGWAVKNRYENQADYARDVTMFNNKMQLQSDRNAAQLYQMAGMNALQSANSAASADELNEIFNGAGSIFSGLKGINFNF